MKDDQPKDRIVYSKLKAEFFARHNDVYVTPTNFCVYTKYTDELQERIPFPYTEEEMEGFE